MMHSTRMTMARPALPLALAAAGPAVAQEGPAGRQNNQFTALEALDASYKQQRRDLECRRIADLAALAEFEHQVLPAVRTKNSTDGAALDTFFRDTDRALDALTYPN